MSGREAAPAVAPAPEAAAPSLGSDADASTPPPASPPLCSGEAGKEYELDVLLALLDENHSHFYVLPACVLKNAMLGTLVFTNERMSDSDMKRLLTEIWAYVCEPGRLLSGGDVVGVDIVMLPICAVNELDASAARSLLKLVEVKSVDRVSANAMAGSLALQLWMERRNVHRRWHLYTPLGWPQRVAPLLLTPPSYMLGALECEGLFEPHQVLSDNVEPVQDAFRAATLPAKDLERDVRDLLRHAHAGEVTSEFHLKSALARLAHIVEEHDENVRAAQRSQAACRERRKDKKRKAEELYREYYD